METTMFELLLMRHAKSDWHNHLADIERPLNKRGRGDADNMGRFLTERGLTPQQALVSPARRAQQTLEYMNQAWRLEGPQVTTDEALYLADEQTLLARVAALIGARGVNGGRIILIAHNPGLDAAVSRIAMPAPQYTAHGKLMTTAAVAVFSVPRIESLSKPASCPLTALYRPREV